MTQQYVGTVNGHVLIEPKLRKFDLNFNNTYWLKYICIKKTYATELGLFCSCWINLIYSGSSIHCLVRGSFRNFTKISGDLNGLEKGLVGLSENNILLLLDILIH